MKKVAFGIILLAASTMMCVFPNPDTELYTRTEPKVTDLVGNYIPTSATLDFIRNKGRYEVVDSFVVLSLDGSFEMVNMPDWWHIFGEPKGGFDSGQGEWSVRKSQGWWELMLDFSSRENFSSEKVSTGLITDVTLVGEAPPYQLWFYVGDPDAGHVMIFEQVTPEGENGS